jgi:type IV pilus assembly protein PilF
MNDANILGEFELTIFYRSGATVARKLLSLTPLCIVCLLLAACDYNTNASMQVTYPYFKEGRTNARIGLDYLHDGETGRAYEKMMQALQQAPNDPLVLDAVGYYYEKSGDLATANGYFFKALTIAPASGTIRDNYGAFLCRNGYKKEAIEYFLQAAHAPEYSGAARSYANARYCAKGLGDTADSAYYTELLEHPIPQSTDTK